MNVAGHLSGSPWTGDKWRFVWLVPVAAGLWSSLLAAFAYLLLQTAPPPPQENAVEARIIEVPAPAGVRGGPAAPAAPHVTKPVVHPVAPRPRVHRVPVHRAPAPPVPPSAEGTAKSVPASLPAASSPSSKAQRAGPATAGGGLSGLGNDSSGARAVYAPPPEIPDELREESLVAVAVAHFVVGDDGGVQVSLAQPTNNPELNELLLSTLKQWRFEPATRRGVAVESQFDLRIPVTVQ